MADHGGWAILVSVQAKDGGYAVVDRRRVEIIDPGLATQPYHHDTLRMNLEDAERLVRGVRESALQCARRALSELQVDTIAMREPPLARLPDTVAEVHASYPVMCRADGMLYHVALTEAAASLGIGVVTFARGTERGRAAEAAGITVARLDSFLNGLRATLGPPWQQEHKEATARAIAALGSLTAPPRRRGK